MQIYKCTFCECQQAEPDRFYDVSISCRECGHLCKPEVHPDTLSLRALEVEHDLAKKLIAFTIKECSEPEALNDPATNSIGQLATSIRDLRADFEEKLAAKDEELAHMENKLRALLPHSNVFLFGESPQE